VREELCPDLVVRQAHHEALIAISTALMVSLSNHEGVREIKKAGSTGQRASGQPEGAFSE
jgi:hypothetical protein